MLHFSAVRNFSSHPRAFKSFGSTSLTRIAKHLALLACLMIIGAATGRPVLGQVGIFIVVVSGGTDSLRRLCGTESLPRSYSSSQEIVVITELLDPAKIVFGLKGDFAQVLETLCKQSDHTRFDVAIAEQDNPG